MDMSNRVYRRLNVGVHRPNSMVVRRAQVEVFDLSGDLSPAVALCMAPEGIIKTSKVAEKLYEAKAYNMDNCIYVIGPDDDEIDAHKIGITCNPWVRLSSLQIGNWHRLRIKALIWATKAAGVAEKLAHKAAGEMELMLNGEWVNMNAADATELALKAARYGKVNVCDGEAYLRNLGARTAAIGRNSVAGREAA
jgi:hypothetical protein